MIHILRGHKAWSTHHEPTREDLQLLWRKHPQTTLLTCTRRGAQKVNVLSAEILRGNLRTLATVGGDFDDNPANFDDKNKLIEHRRPLPSKMHLFKGLRVQLTRNQDKKNHFVNGMEAEVEDYDPVSGCITVLTKTGRTIAVYLYTDVDQDHNNPMPFYPMRYGYASTIYKRQGAQLSHVTIWLDQKNMRAHAYVAMSRVRRDGDYLFGGHYNDTQSFVPNV
jgi:ATP-dependent exoDNAse (exonuclease V) alpha subunit